MLPSIGPISVGINQSYLTQAKVWYSRYIILLVKEPLCWAYEFKKSGKIHNEFTDEDILDGFVLSGPVGDRYIAYVAHTYLAKKVLVLDQLVELMCYYLSKQKGVVRYR